MSAKVFSYRENMRAVQAAGAFHLTALKSRH